MTVTFSLDVRAPGRLLGCVALVLIATAMALAATPAGVGAAAPPGATDPQVSALPHDLASRRCKGSRVYGASSIRVREAVGIGCTRALRLARSAVVFRVGQSEFPTSFCRRGWCWRFSEARGDEPGLSEIRFHGRRGSARIRATQFVS